MDSKSGMENVDKLIQIYRQLANCTSSNEFEALTRRLKDKSTDAKNVPSRERKMEEAEQGGREELGIQRREQNRLSVTELGKKVEDLTVEVEKLIDRGRFTTEELTVEVRRKFELPTTDLVGEDANRYAQEILEFLETKEVCTIGVWGMGGVGKTSLVKRVYNCALNHFHLFGSVYWITVSNDCSVPQLQLLLARRVGEDLSGEDDECLRASRLTEALEEKSKFTIFLDDMWTHFDLITAGIPKTNGCKLILTTRSEDVCDRMLCDKTIQVQPLQQEEARKLFFKNVGHEMPNAIIETATLVVKECGGLPLAIITLSKSMRNKCDIHEWRNVLNMLQRSNPGVKDMGKKVFDILRLSFDRLNNSKVQECLLHCATYPEDNEIKRNELIWRFIDEGLLDMNATTREMFDQGHTILNELEGAALLLRKDSYQISMHDLIRDMALQIAGFRFMVKAGVGLKDFPYENIWTDKVELVSLGKNYIRKIPDLKVKCWRLSTLVLQNNFFNSLPDSFFENLHGLKVLDLSYSIIQAFPKSLLSLKELTSLDLHCCMFLKTMPNMSRLSSLRRLDLSYSGLTEVPRGVEDLINLIYLNFVGMGIRRIDSSVLRRLIALEVLGIPKFDMNAEELTHLKKLEHVQLGFERIEIFTAFVKHMQMNGRPSSYFLALNKRGGFGLGSWVTKFMDDILSSRLSLETLTPEVNDTFGQKHVEVGMERNLPMLPDNVHDLDVVDNQDITSLCDYLSSCLIIKRLSLRRLWNLKSLFGSGPELSSSFSFSNLRTLTIIFCPKINKLFSVRLLSCLQNIEEITIGTCHGLEEVIEVESDAMVEREERGKTDSYALPKLTTLVLGYLPELESICSREGVLECVSLQKIEIAECPKLRRMPFSLQKQQQPRVYLYSEDVEWVNTLNWDPPESKGMVQIQSGPVFTDSQRIKDIVNNFDDYVRTAYIKTAQFHNQVENLQHHYRRLT